MLVALQATAYINRRLGDAFDTLKREMTDPGSEDVFLDANLAAQALDELGPILDELDVLKSCLARLAIWMGCPGRLPSKCFRQWTRAF
jgi:hypothetical protein